MTQPLTYRIDRRLPIAVVSLAGELTPLSSAVARTALLDALAAEPTAVVVDLSGLTTVDDIALTVFPAVADLAARWPGAALLLSAPPPAVDKALRQLAVTPRLPVYPTRQAAIEIAATEPVPLRVHLRLEPTVDAPRIARELAYDTCWEWDLAEAATPAKIVSSELVTNAVRHAGTVVDMTVTRQDHRVRVSVRDGVTQPARLQTPTEAEDHGRGLLIVDSLASSWGNMSLVDGKAVWAVVAPRWRSGGRPAVEADHGSQV